jgi:hypothetical protein
VLNYAAKLGVNEVAESDFSVFGMICPDFGWNWRLKNKCRNARLHPGT